MKHAWAKACLVGLILAGSTSAATYTSSGGNFLVRARRIDVAQSVGEYAEYYRRQLALEWLGFELPAWRDPCTVHVRVTHGGAGGATSFAFENGQVLGQDMTVEGPLDRILESVLAHEVTHTIFAAKFRRPLPRWADEGGAVLSEDGLEVARHDRMVRELINDGRMIPLSRLFVLTEYPNDVMSLYAQGFSVARYLVSLRGRRVFLDFVWDGQQFGWRNVVERYYGFRTIDELERNWIRWLATGYGTGADRASLVVDSRRRLPAADQNNNRSRVANFTHPAATSATPAAPVSRDAVAWITPGSAVTAQPAYGPQNHDVPQRPQKAGPPMPYGKAPTRANPPNPASSIAALEVGPTAGYFGGSARKNDRASRGNDALPAPLVAPQPTTVDVGSLRHRISAPVGRTRRLLDDSTRHIESGAPGF
jgi:hypothetical protein